MRNTNDAHAIPVKVNAHTLIFFLKATILSSGVLRTWLWINRVIDRISSTTATDMKDSMKAGFIKPISKKTIPTVQPTLADLRSCLLNLSHLSLSPSNTRHCIIRLRPSTAMESPIDPNSPNNIKHLHFLYSSDLYPLL